MLRIQWTAKRTHQKLTVSNRLPKTFRERILSNFGHIARKNAESREVGSHRNTNRKTSEKTVSHKMVKSNQRTDWIALKNLFNLGQDQKEWKWIVHQMTRLLSELSKTSKKTHNAYI